MALKDITKADVTRIEELLEGVGPSLKRCETKLDGVREDVKALNTSVNVALDVLVGARDKLSQVETILNGRKP